MNSQRLPARELALGAVYFLVSLVALLLTRAAGGIALIWPASALAAAVLIRLPTVRWFSAAATLLVAGAVNVVSHRGWQISMLFSCLNGVEIALTVYAFRRVARFNYPDISIAQATLMTAVFGVAIPGLVAIPGGVVLHGMNGTPLMQATVQWWSSHTLGACLIAPAIILWSTKSLRRLLSANFRIENIAILLITLLGTALAIRYVRFPFVLIAVFLSTAAFRVGAFGSALLSLCCGFSVAALWSLGLRPEGLESSPIVSSLATLPVFSLLITTMPPIAVALGADARRKAVRQLNLSERRFRESMEHSPIGMLIAHLDGVWGYTNIALQTMLGYSAEEFRAMPPGGPSESGQWEASASRWQRLLSREINSYDVERRFRHKEGHWIWTHVAISVARDEDGSPLYFIAQIENLEARRRAEANLAEERERLRITLSFIADAVITTDADTHITYINAAGEKLLGQALQALEQRRLDEMVCLTEPHTAKTAANLVAQSRLHGSMFRRDAACVLHRADGTVCYVRDVVSPVLNPQGFITGFVVVFQDASADFERERDLSYRASHDPLTGLSNRFEFQRRLTQVFQRARLTQIPAAVLVIDLDLFKAINDVGGHAAGDAVLRRVAEVLQKSISIRQSDTIARVGGDEFAVILERVPQARCVFVANKTLQALNPLRIDWQGQTYEIGASVGMAMMTSEFDSDAAWLAAADQACYDAKHAGRGQLRIGQGPRAPAAEQHSAMRPASGKS